MCKSPEEAETSRAINCAVPGVVVSPTVKQVNNQNSKYRKKKFIHKQGAGLRENTRKNPFLVRELPRLIFLGCHSF